MKHFALAILLVLVASPVFAAVQVTFTDGSTTVWNTYVVRGDKYCTRLVFGEICYPRSDVRSLSKAPAENAGSDYGMSVIGSDAAGNNDLGAVLGKSEAEDRAFKAKRDAEIESRSRAEQKRVKSNRDHGKSEWAR